MHEAHRLGDAQLAKLARQKRCGLVRCGAVKAYGRAADILDLAEHILAILLADHIAQHSPQHADDGALFFRVVLHRDPVRAHVAGRRHA